MSRIVVSVSLEKRTRIARSMGGRGRELDVQDLLDNSWRSDGAQKYFAYPN